MLSRTAVSLNVLARVVQGIGTLLALVTVVHRLTPSEQGGFYAIQNIIGWQVAAELGLTFCVMQTSSHLAGHIFPEKNGGIAGDRCSIDKLASLYRQARMWFSTIFIAALAITVTAAYRVLYQQSEEHHSIPQATISAICLAASVSVLLQPRIAIIEGLGNLEYLGKLKLFQELLSYIALVAAIHLGFGLISLAGYYGMRFAVALCAIQFRWRKLFSQLRATKVKHTRLRWSTDVWPLQWKVAVASVSGVALFLYVVPLAYARYGDVEGGRIGATLTLMNGVQAITLLWVTTHSSRFGRMIACGDVYGFDREFRRAFLQGLMAALLLLVFLNLSAILAFPRFPDLMSRFVSGHNILLLSLAVAINYMTFSMSTYMRAFKQEPLYLVSLAGALSTVLLLSMGTNWFSFENFVTLYVIASAPGSIMVALVFVSFRKQRIGHIPAI